MKRMYKIALLSIFVFSVFAVSFTTIPSTTYTNVKTDDVSLEGKTWTTHEDYIYCSLRFISDRTVIIDAYWIENEAHPGFGGSYFYYYDGERGQLWDGDRNDSRSRIVGHFRICNNCKGATMKLKMYEGDSGPDEDGGFTLWR